METQVFYFFLTPSFLLIAIITTYLYHSYLFHHNHNHHHKSPTYTFISFFNNRHRLLSWYTDLLSQSPSQTVVIRRLTPPKTIITANPKNIEYMLKTHFTNFPKGKPFTDVLQDFLGTGIFNVDGDLWHAQRKLASHQFTSRSLKQHVKTTLVEAVNTKLLPFLDSLAAADHDSPAPVVDFQEVLRRLGFDIVCKLSLGFDPCCLDHELPILKAFDTAAGISAKRAATPIAAVWKLKRFFRIGSEKVLEDSVKVIHGYITEIVDERRKNILKYSEKTELDLLSRMIITGGVTEEQIRDMVISFIMAGRDTTSSAMTWLFYVVSRHAHVEEKLVKEIRCKFKENDELCEKEKLKEMKYLQACICETMRLYPPVSWDSKHAVDDDVLPDGTPVRSGDRVTYFPYGMGRMERLWGVDRLEFRPDRWLGGGEEMKEVSPYKYPVFHAGPRVCLGKGLANVQMSYVVASILNRFEIRPVRVEEAVYLPLLTAHMEGGFKVWIRRRPPTIDATDPLNIC